MKPVISWKLPLFVFVAFVLLQLPFIQSDPDTLADINTRGAWIDEGLYTFQTREWIDSGSLNLSVSDAFLRSPVYQLFLSGFFLIFGTHVFAARLLTVMLVAFALAMLVSRRSTRTSGIILALAGLSQFHLLQFSHYSLVYMSAVSWLIVSLVFLIDAAEGRKPVKKAILSTLAVFLAYGTTIQMLPAAIIIPSVAFFLWISGLLKRTPVGAGLFLFTSLFSLLFLAIYFLVWFLPHQELFNQIVFFQTEGRFPDTVNMFREVFAFNVEFVLWIPELIPYFILAFAALILRMLGMGRRSGTANRVIFLFGLFWLLIEIPKWGMFYIPFRYLLPGITAMVLLSVFSLSVMIRTSAMLRIAAVWFTIGLFITNAIHYTAALNRRTHDLEVAGNYVSSNLPSGSTVLGAWAPALTWGSNTHCIPVWKGYMNCNQPVETFRPIAVVAEYNEADSDGCFASSGIDLESICDSSRRFPVWRYELVIYWMKP